MFESLRSHSNSHQPGISDGFVEATTRFQYADSEAKHEISQAIETANSMLVRTYSSLGKFFALPKVDQMNFVGEISAKAAVSKRANPRIGLGFELYKIWLVANIERDQVRIDRFMSAINQ